MLILIAFPIRGLWTDGTVKTAIDDCDAMTVLRLLWCDDCIGMNVMLWLPPFVLSCKIVFSPAVCCMWFTCKNMSKPCKNTRPLEVRYNCIIISRNMKKVSMVSYFKDSRTLGMMQIIHAMVQYPVKIRLIDLNHQNLINVHYFCAFLFHTS